MSKSRRDQQRDNTREEIKTIARQHMAQHGTNALALRAIAREMDISAAALYRYFASLDDLITALILDAFNAMADALEAAAASQPRDDYAARLHAVLLAYRQWALDNPAEFQLIYGNPIPGYEAPSELTRAAAVRSNQVVGGILAEAHQAGKLKTPPEYPHLPETVQNRFDAVSVLYDPPLSSVVLYVAAVGWTHIHGIVMLELFHHLQGVVGDSEAFYRFAVRNLINTIGL